MPKLTKKAIHSRRTDVQTDGRTDGRTDPNNRKASLLIIHLDLSFSMIELVRGA